LFKEISGVSQKMVTGALLFLQISFLSPLFYPLGGPISRHRLRRRPLDVLKYASRAASLLLPRSRLVNIPGTWTIHKIMALDFIV